MVEVRELEGTRVDAGEVKVLFLDCCRGIVLDS